MKTIILKDCDGTPRKMHLAGNASDYTTDDLIDKIDSQRLVRLQK